MKSPVPPLAVLSRVTPALLTLVLVSAGCTVGPTYQRPPIAMPPAFKEPSPANLGAAEAAGWKQSEPGDAYAKGRWWELFDDPTLNGLEEQVNVSNQNVLQAEAQYRQARATARAAHAPLFPTVTAAPAITTGRATATGNGADVSRQTSYNLPIDVSWEPDLWGSIRRGVAAGAATAEALAANVGNARLLYQTELARSYFGLRGLDAAAELLSHTEASYEEYLTLTRNRLTAGVASDLDVAQAEAQLYATQTQLMDLGVQRAAFEHAIAVLIGKAPAELTIQAVPSAAAPSPVPPIPLGVPSALLERRPDVAAAERQVAAANEGIGIAMAAFFPNLSLTGGAGLASSSLSKWLTWPSRFWSVGPQLAATLFDGGRRRAVVAEQQAAYDAVVAAYRETALGAMQQVEDNLAALRILALEADKVRQTVQASTRALDIASAQYRAGTASYLTVITSQATLLDAKVTEVTLSTRRLTASVQLIAALGGGWNASQFPAEPEGLAPRR